MTKLKRTTEYLSSLKTARRLCSTVCSKFRDSFGPIWGVPVRWASGFDFFFGVLPGFGFGFGLHLWS